MKKRGFAVALLAAWGCAGEALPEPETVRSSATAAAPPPEPPKAEPAPAPTAEAPPPAAPAPAEPPKPIVWKKVDLGGSSAEMPETAEVKTAPESSDMPGARAATADLEGFSLFAGDGPFRFRQDMTVNKLLKAPLAHSPAATMKQSVTEAKGFTEERVIVGHLDGETTIVRVRTWPGRAGKLGRIAWRMVSFSGPGGSTPEVTRFLDSLGPEPVGKTKTSNGFISPLGQRAPRGTARDRAGNVVGCVSF
jgi:hypothetical protein